MLPIVDLRTLSGILMTYRAFCYLIIENDYLIILHSFSISRAKWFIFQYPVPNTRCLIFIIIYLNNVSKCTCNRLVLNSKLEENYLTYSRGIIFV